MSNSVPTNQNDTFHTLSVLSIKYDCETLIALAPIVTDPIYSLGLLPYLALFCCAVEEYCQATGQAVDFFKGSPFNLAEIRCRLKLFDDRYGRTKNKITTIDDLQNTYFSNLLSFKFLKRLNVHYNLGIYIDNDNHMIGNTQYMYYMFQDKRFSKSNRMQKENIQELGYVMGSTVGSVYEGLKNVGTSLNAQISSIDVPFFYKDYNTNRSFNSFPNHEDGKELTLRLVHILCALNFVEKSLKSVINNTNLWFVRAKYITFYYAYRSIKTVNNKYPGMISISGSNGIERLLNSDFRSCMMHYSYKNDGHPLIDSNSLDPNVPFFGLIKSCFGMSFDDFNCALDSAINQLSISLENLLKFDFSDKKPL